MANAVFVCSRVICARISFHTTPFEIWTYKKSAFGMLCVFGSLCWYHARREQSLKHGDRGSSAMLIGYTTKQKAYKIWDDVNQKLLILRNSYFKTVLRASTSAAS